MSTRTIVDLQAGLVDAISHDERGTSQIAAARTDATLSLEDRTSDEVLLDAVGKGSKPALGVLFRRHGRAVRQVAWRILRDESEAEDLRQEVFLYLFDRARQFDASKSSGASWIIQIAYHRAIDRRRFLTCRQHYTSAELNEQHDGGSTRESLIERIDGKAILERMREELSPEQQQTLGLHFFEGYSFREIAERSGQTLGNVRNHYYRALDRLRSNLFSKKRG